MRSLDRRNADANGDCSANATPADGAVSTVEQVSIFADRSEMKRQEVIDRIDILADRQLMLCDFARMAIGKRDRKAAEMLVKDAMLVDVELRGMISRLGPMELIGR